jgi:hypothetical protein
MKYFIGFLASIALIILVVVLIVRGFSGGGEEPKSTTKQLVDYANTSAEVSFFVDGEISAEETHNAYRIIVGRDEAVIETYQGYEETVLERVEYENNNDSYANFLRALDLAGFSRGENTKANDDPRGVCASQNRFILQIENGSSQIQDFWTTSCGGGNFKGDIAAVRQLFIRQVPEHSKLTRKLNL